MTGSSVIPLVAHVIFRLDHGGLQNGLVNLVNRMPANRYRHAIVCLGGFQRDFARRIRRNDVELVSLDKRPGKDVAVYRRMWQTLRRLRPDIVHTRNLGTVDMQWVAFAAGVRRRVHGEHGWEAADPRGRDPRSLRIRRACRPVIQRYVPMSRDLARWLESDVGVRPAIIRQAYSGVDTERFRPRRDGESASSDDARVRFGAVGRLDPVKNLHSLLDAFRLAREGRPDLVARLSLVIVGDGPARASLESSSRELGLAHCVEFTGTREEIPELMRSIHVFVLPSLNEGISNTLLEAMASGVPVIAARVGGNPEIVTEGVTGALYDPDSPGALVAQLVRYAEDASLRRAHGTAGRERVLAAFSLDAMIDRYLEIYDELTCAA